MTKPKITQARKGAQRLAAIALLALTCAAASAEPARVAPKPAPRVAQEAKTAPRIFEAVLVSKTSSAKAAK